MALIPNSPLINNFRYKQSTSISQADDLTCHPILSVADGGNGQLVLTTDDTTNVAAGVAITLEGMSVSAYDGDYTVISFTTTTINVSGVFTVTATGNWKFASALSAGVAGDPLDFGTIEFFNATNKTVQQDIFKDREGLVAYPNPLTLSSVGTVPPIYMQDLPYYIEIRDKFNNIVEALDNYSPSEGGGENALEVVNLFPSYGFDSIIDNGNYSENTLPLSTPNNVVSAGWVYELSTANTNSVNNYSFEALLDSGLLGNPKNELIISSTNNNTGDTLKNLRATIGDYQAFQNGFLNLSVYLRIISGSASELNVFLRRSEGGVNQTPILIGQLPITSLLTQQTLQISVGSLVAGNYVNSDVLDLYIELPLNQDFSIGFTGMWLQEAASDDDSEIDINEGSVSVNQARQFFGNGFRDLQAQITSNSLGLPIVMDGGSATVANKTGAVFVGKKDNSYNYAVALNNYPGDTLIRNTPLGFTSSNRLIDFLRDNKVTQSRLTLLAEKIVSQPQVTFTIGIGNNRSGNATANAGGRITVTNQVETLKYGMFAVIDDENVHKVTFTFRDNFNANTNGYNPSIAGFGGQSAYVIPPVFGPIINWFGTSVYYSTSNTVNVRMRFDPYLTTTRIFSGSGSDPAVDEIYFRDNNNLSFNASNVTAVFTPSAYDERYDPTYLNQNMNIYGNTGFLGSIQHGYLAYNDITDNPANQPIAPPRVIRYSVDGNSGSAAPIGTVSTLLIALNSSDSAQTVALKTALAVNSTWEELLEVVSTPVNGDTVTFPIDLGTDGYIIIMHDTTLSLPANPDPTKTPIYVGFTGSDTIEQIAQNITDTVNASHVGVPYWPDLGLPPLASTDYTYFMYY